MANNMTPINPQQQQQDIVSQILERTAKTKNLEADAIKKTADANKINIEVEKTKAEIEKTKAEQLDKEIDIKTKKLNILDQQNKTPTQEDSQQQNIFDITSEAYGEGQIGGEPYEEAGSAPSWAYGRNPGEMEQSPSVPDNKDGLLEVNVSGTRDVLGGEEEIPEAGIFDDDDDRGVAEQIVVPEQPDVEDPYGNVLGSKVTTGGSTAIQEESKYIKTLEEERDKIDNQIQNSVNIFSEELEDSKEERKKYSNFFNNLEKDYTNLLGTFKKQNEELDQSRKELITPSYRKAISDIPLISKVSAIIYAAIGGYLGQKNPLNLLEKLIDQNYQDQVAEYEMESELLEKKENYYSKTFNISKDAIITKSNFFQARYEQAMDEIDRSMNLKQYDNKQKNALLQIKSNLSLKIGEHIEMKREQQQKLVEKQAEKIFDHQLKLIRDEEKLKGQMRRDIVKMKREGPEPRAIYSQSDPKKVIVRYGVGANKLYTDAATSNNDTITTGKVSQQIMDIVERVGNKTLLKAAKSTILSKIGEKLPWTAKVSEKIQKDYNDFERLRLILIRMALSNRIAFTGGGNMNRDEASFLMRYHRLKFQKESGTMSEIELNDRMSDLIRGNFDIFTSVIAWENANSSYYKMKTTGYGFDMSFKDYIKKEMKLKGNLLKDVLRMGHSNQSPTILQTQPILEGQ